MNKCNEQVFAAKEQRRIEKANYPVEKKLEIVEKLRDTARDLRLNSRIVKRGQVIK